MATLKAPKTISKRQELRKDAATTVFVKVQGFFYENRTLVYGIAVGVVVVLLAIAGYAFLQSQRGVQAEEVLGGIILVYERGDYRAALDGTPEAVGLLEIIDEYGGTPAGNLARFYAADASFRLSQIPNTADATALLDQALEFFQDFDGGDDIVGASALAGEAAIYEIKEDHARAGDLFRRAALLEENELSSPSYLMGAGRAYEKAGQYQDAHSAYQLIKDNYPESTQAQGIDFFLGRVGAKLN